MYMNLWLKVHGGATVNMHIKVMVYILIPSKMLTFETNQRNTRLLPTPEQRHRSGVQDRTTGQCLCFRYIESTMVQLPITKISSL